MAVLEDKDRPHRDAMEGAVMPQAVGYAPRLRQSSSAFSDAIRQVHRHAPRKNPFRAYNIFLVVYLPFVTSSAGFVETVAMPTPLELLRVAHLIKLAADTGKACSEMKPSDHTARIREISLRIKAAAKELEEVGREMDGEAPRRDN